MSQTHPVCSSHSSQSDKSLSLLWSRERVEIKLSFFNTEENIRSEEEMIFCTILQLLVLNSVTFTVKSMVNHSVAMALIGGDHQNMMLNLQHQLPLIQPLINGQLRHCFQKALKCIRTEPKFNRCQDDSRPKAKNSLPVPLPKSQYVQSHCPIHHIQDSIMRLNDNIIMLQ